MNNEVEKKLVVEPENKNLFSKIKMFFKNLFKGKNNLNKSLENDKMSEDNSFWNTVNNVENEETELLKLQIKYRDGEIKEEELTKEQVSALCDLYDRQIAQLKQSIEYRTQKILEYRKSYKREKKDA